jgi:hypothetical protein
MGCLVLLIGLALVFFSDDQQCLGVILIIISLFIPSGDSKKPETVKNEEEG